MIKEKIKSTNKEIYGQNYQNHILEQYKIYLSMVDKISDRRAIANTFFLTINTGLITALGFSNFITVGEKTKVDPFFIIIIPSAAILFCYIWYRIIRSYKDLNSAKFKVIHEMEEYLPLKPFDAEWEALGYGKDKTMHLPFTNIEIKLPFVFIFIYIGLLIYGLLKI